MESPLCWNPEWVQVVHSEGSMLWELSSDMLRRYAIYQHINFYHRNGWLPQHHMI